MNKSIKTIYNHIEAMIGEQATGAFLALIADSLDKFVKGVDKREIRNVEFTINGFYSLKYDFEKGGYGNKEEK